MDNKKVVEIYKEERPWGNFERFTQNKVSTVKIINVRPNERLSLQSHEQRSEFWKILSGSGEVTLDGEVKKAQMGDEFDIPVRGKHNVEGGNEGISFLEISFGHFDENDEVRLEDKYGRQNQ